MSFSLIITWCVRIVIGICALVLFDYVVELLKSITKYFSVKSTTKVPVRDRLNNTGDTLLLINKLIEIYLLDKQVVQLTLGVPFKVIKMDQDIKEVAEFVHNSLSPDLFKSTGDMAVTEEYIEKYIVSQSTAALMECYQATNQKIAEMNGRIPG